MSKLQPRGGHVDNRPHSSARISSNLVEGAIPQKIIRQNAIWSKPDREAAQLPPGCLAIARVENIHAGRPREFPSKESVENKSSGKCKYTYTAILSKYGKKKDGVVENRYDLDIVENIVFPHDGTSSSDKIATFRFGSQTKLEVLLLREVREIQLFKFFPQTSERAKSIKATGDNTPLEDIFWTLNLSQKSNQVFRQGHQLWKTLQSTLEVLSWPCFFRVTILTSTEIAPSHLSYANVHRQLVGPFPVSNLHGMQSRSKTGEDYATSLYHLDNRNTIQTAQEPRRLHSKPFVITVPNSQGGDWHFRGHLADPSFVAEFDKVAAGMGSDKQPPSVKGHNTTHGRKCKKRRAKKAAKALRAQQESEEGQREDGDVASKSKRGAPESSHAASKKQRR